MKYSEAFKAKMVQKMLGGRSARIRPAKAGVDLRRQNCPVLRQKRVDLVGGR